MLVGKTTMPDFGFLGAAPSSFHALSRNPWDLSRNTGGSSSGAGAAVAAGYGPLHLGTDTRQPGARHLAVEVSDHPAQLAVKVSERLRHDSAQEVRRPNDPVVGHETCTAAKPAPRPNGKPC